MDDMTFERVIGNLSDELTLLRGEGIDLKEDGARIVADAIISRCTDPETIDQIVELVIASIQKRIVENTGRGVFKAIKAVLTHWFVVGIMFLYALKYFGSDAARGLWAIFSGGSR